MSSDAVSYDKALLACVLALLVSSCAVATLGSPSISWRSAHEPPDCDPQETAASASLADESPARVDYVWYDFFNVPLEEWWEARYDTYQNDLPLTDSYPYLYRHYYSMPGLFDTSSSARLNVTGRDMPVLSMSDRPEFLPFLSGNDGPRGGTAVIDWYMQYLTSEAFLAEFPGVMISSDGWIVALTGKVTFDKDAAMAVLNVTAEGWDDFADWWEANEDETTAQYLNWIKYEAGRHRLDIFNMYGYPLTFLRFDLSAEKVADRVVLHYDTISWGMEAMMTRWLHEAFMPTEWWFEDFRMHAEIGPDAADIDIDTAVAYAVRAWETKDSGEPCWTWQGMMQDIHWSTIAHPNSTYDLWCPLSHVCHSPGCGHNGEMVPYEYVPGSFNLSHGESLTFVRPPGEVTFMAHVSADVTDNTTAQARISYTEPLLEEMPNRIETDTSGSILTFTGPIDFWSWSRDQSSHENLADEWDRLGILPWGMPYIELTMDTENSPPSAHLEAYRPTYANKSTVCVFDASGSSDEEDALCQMWFRWDTDGDGSWDTGWGHDHLYAVDFPGLGEYTARVEVMDNMGETDTASASIAVTDLTPPITSVDVSGLEGSPGWYRSDVRVNMTATDDGSGVSSTYYRLGDGPWETFVSAMTLEAEGGHALSYYSVDNECNEEMIGEVFVQIDKTAPVLVVITDAASHTTSNVTIRWVRSDELSGVNRTEVALDGQHFVSCGFATERTFSGLSEGSHAVQVRAYDNAGNYVTESYTFTVDLYDPTDGSPEEDDEDAALYFAIAAVAAVAVIVVVAALLMRSRGKG